MTDTQLKQLLAKMLPEKIAEKWAGLILDAGDDEPTEGIKQAILEATTHQREEIERLTKERDDALQRCQEFAKQLGDALNEGKRQAAVKKITLTGDEIRSLAQFVGFPIDEDNDIDDDIKETEYTIETFPSKGIKDEDEILKGHRFIAYLDEYPEEGCVPLGKSIKPTGGS